VTRFVVDCGVVLRLASEGIEVPAEHELLAPTLLRSQTLSALHEAVHRGELTEAVASRSRGSRQTRSSPSTPSSREKGIVPTAPIEALR
jgi:hypothetical protein